ncbi:hypothetical protein ACLKA6_003087 [Drosophila palustris]
MISQREIFMAAALFKPNHRATVHCRHHIHSPPIASKWQKVGKLHHAVQKALAETDNVIVISDKVRLEIRDLPEWPTAEDVTLAVLKHIEGDLPVESAPKLRKGYRGTQIASMFLTKAMADTLLAMRDIRIGWALCSIRSTVDPRRCYKCLEFGHTAARCRNKHDASKKCFNCGGEGHSSKDCGSHTFTKAGRGSIIDLTFASPCLARNSKWAVSSLYTHSDHQALLFTTGANTYRTRQPSFTSWSQETLDEGALLIIMDTIHIQASEDPDVYANNTAQAIKNACDASMLRKRKGGKCRKPVHWWNEDIADARRQCLVARRRQQRSRGRHNFLQLLENYREKRAILKKAIKRSKALCWENLCAEADEQPFGTAYKVVMGKLARRPMPTDPEQLLDIVTTLFPEHPATNLAADIQQTAPKYTEITEILEAAANIKVNKAPGPDGVPSKAGWGTIPFPFPSQNEEFSSILNDLVEDVRDHSPAVIAGDFNSWALELQSPVTNARGRVLLDAFATLDVELLNRGSTHTFSRGGMGSIIDLTFATSCLARSATWSVSEIYTASDHRAIVFNFGGRNSAPSNMPTRTHYKSATLDVDAFQLAIGNMSVSGNAETMAQQAAQALQHACGVSMQRSGSYRRHNAVYWWTDQIAKARAECLKARRAYCRARGTEAHASLRLQYCDKRRLLKRAIKDQKRLCFLRMCEEADHDPWGQAYKVVMKRTRSFKNSVPTEKMQLTAIVSTLFPHQHERNPDHTNDEQNNHPVATITAGEVIQAARSIKNDTAPGPDGIPNRALKLAISV